MGVIRTAMAPLIKGGVGGFSYYVKSKRQQVRVRKNNSNYGEGARRSLAQQSQRVKWPNMVAVYRQIQGWGKKAFQLKGDNQTDFNRFMSLNIESAEVYLTKEQFNMGACVFNFMRVSDGSLPEVTLISTSFPGQGNTQFVRTNILLSGDLSTFSNYGAFCQSLINNNLGRFKDGDALAFIEYVNYLDTNSIPRAVSYYQEIVLDVTSTAEVGDFLPLEYCRTNDSNEFCWGPARQDTNGVGCSIIHTRLQKGKLLISPAQLYLYYTEFSRPYCTNTAKAAAIASYGLDVDVELIPGE